MLPSGCFEYEYDMWVICIRICIAPLNEDFYWSLVKLFSSNLEFSTSPFPYISPIVLESLLSFNSNSATSLAILGFSA